MACVKGGRAFPIRYALGYGFYKSSEIKVIIAVRGFGGTRERNFPRIYEGLPGASIYL